jgi:hypothetical protein
MPARNPSRSADPRAHDARSLAAVIVAGMLLGGVASVMLRSAAEWLAPGSAEAQASATKPGPTAKATPGVKPAAAPKTAGTATTTAKPTVPATKSAPTATSVRPVPASKTPTAVTSGAKGSKTAAPSARTSTVQSSAHLDEQLTYQYNALGRRDPFQSLLNGEYVGSDLGGDAPPDVGGLKVVGIVWGDADQFALVEDARGDSHILRRGDKVMNGFVEALKRDAMVVNLTVDGQSQSVTVPLTRKGEKTNANR